MFSSFVAKLLFCFKSDVPPVLAEKAIPVLAEEAIPVLAKEAIPVLATGRKFEIIPNDVGRLRLDREIYKKFLKDINTAIAKFNKNESTDANNIALAEMEEAIHYVDSNSTPDTLASAEEFHKLKASLFNKIKKLNKLMVYFPCPK